MPFSDYHSRQSLIPSFLYSSSSSKRLYDLEYLMNTHHIGLLNQSPPSISASSNGNGLVIPAPNEKIEMYSPSFYAACTIGGILSCGLTHMAVTPLDLVKCNMQVSLIYDYPDKISFSFTCYGTFEDFTYFTRDYINLSSCWLLFIKYAIWIEFAL